MLFMRRAKEVIMTAIGYFNAFRAFGADVLLLALGVTLVTSLLKKTVMKKCPGKAFVFLPFALGAVLYAAYRAVATMSAAPFTEELAQTLEGGFACGCASTLYYVVYKQFFRRADRSGKETSVLSPLLEGFVPEEALDAAAEELTAGYGALPEEERRGFIRETFAKYALPDLTEAETEAVILLVERYLSAIFA